MFDNSWQTSVCFAGFRRSHLGSVIPPTEADRPVHVIVSRSHRKKLHCVYSPL